MTNVDAVYRTTDTNDELLLLLIYDFCGLTIDIIGIEETITHTILSTHEYPENHTANRKDPEGRQGVNGWIIAYPCLHTVHRI